MNRWTPYHYAICVVTLVPRKFSAAAKARRTDVDTVAGFADGICAFDSDGVGEVTATAVAFDLEPRFRHGCERFAREGWIKRGEKRPTLDFFRRLRLSLPVSDGHWMSLE